MSHYSEMSFLFSNDDNRKEVNKILNNTSQDNKFNIFKGSPNYVVYKGNGNNTIKDQISDSIYKNDNKNNPYINLIREFRDKPSLEIKASDLSYLKNLGQYPMNRMIILRRFDEGLFVPENLDEMKSKPLSTVIGWLKDEQEFPEISFNETWGKTEQRFDTLLTNIINNQIKGGNNAGNTPIIPIPDFAQGILFEFYKDAGLTGDENSNWGLNNIPVGDPNVLQEGPFRDPVGQNIKSSLVFDLETTYEQKLLGDVDPGSAMLDIIDNLFAMGT